MQQAMASIFASVAFVVGVILALLGLHRPAEVPPAWIGAVAAAAAWAIVRCQPYCGCYEHIGTRYLGWVNGRDRPVMTKWICFYLPVVPVRSYVVLNDQLFCSDDDRFLGTGAQYVLAPVTGWLGFDLRLVGKTLVWPMVPVWAAIFSAIAIAIAIAGR